MVEALTLEPAQSNDPASADFQKRALEATEFSDLKKFRVGDVLEVFHPYYRKSTVVAVTEEMVKVASVATLQWTRENPKPDEDKVKTWTLEWNELWAVEKITRPDWKRGGAEMIDPDTHKLVLDDKVVVVEDNRSDEDRKQSPLSGRPLENNGTKYAWQGGVVRATIKKHGPKAKAE